MSLPYMPLYIGDYLRDTKRLTTLQHGAYLLLLMDAWNHDGLLPAEPSTLAAIARVPTKNWGRMWEKLGPLFYSVDEGGVMGWRHKRVQSELQRVLKKSSARSSAGAAGAEAKRLKRQQTQQANAHAPEAIASIVASKDQASHSQKPEPIASLAASKHAAARQEIFNSAGPGVADREDFAASVTDDELAALLMRFDLSTIILPCIRKRTAKPLPNPIRSLHGLIAAFAEFAPQQTFKTNQNSGSPNPPQELPKLTGKPKLCVEAIAERHGQAAAAAWFAEVEFNGKKIYAPSDFHAGQLDTRFGNILGQFGYQAVCRNSGSETEGVDGQ